MTDNVGNLLENSDCGRSCITPGQNQTIAPRSIKSLGKEQEDDKQNEESCPGHRPGISFEQETWP
eukprot:11044739-Karenia_brevis.AAC.1